MIRFDCPKCNKGTVRDDLVDHEWDAHGLGGMLKESYRCDQCGEEFTVLTEIVSVEDSDGTEHEIELNT